jgi:hypothetical protein
VVNDDYDHEKFVVKAGQPYYNGTDALLDKTTQIKQWSKIPELTGKAYETKAGSLSASGSIRP